MIKTVPEILFNTVRQYPQNIALKIKKDESYQTFSYYELGEQVKILASGLAKLGLNTGDKIAILSNNRPEWPTSDFAIFCLRGITVPIYQTLPPNQIEYILKNSETRPIFGENQEQFDKIREIDTALPGLTDPCSPWRFICSRPHCILWTSPMLQGSSTHSLLLLP